MQNTTHIYNLLRCSLFWFLLAIYVTPTIGQDPQIPEEQTDKVTQVGFYTLWLVGAVGATFAFIPLGSVWVFIFSTLFGSMVTSEIGGTGGILSVIWSAYYFNQMPWDLHFFS